jgi:hypothetical protein
MPGVPPIRLTHGPGRTADGKRNRSKRKGRTKAIVKARLTELADDLNRKVTTSRAHTVLSVVTEYVDELERGGKAPSEEWASCHESGRLLFNLAALFVA